MKVLVTLAIFLLLQATNGQIIKDAHKLAQQNQKDDINKYQGQDQDDASPSNQNANHEQNAVDQSQLVEQHNKPTVKVEASSSDQSKVSVEIPPKVQQIVTQVSQHIPQVVAQHVASQKRMVRSAKKRMAWQAMQVNAIEQPGRCEFICNQLDVAACGYNDRCYWEFENQCDLSTYNCLNTDKPFHIVDFAKCQDVSAPKCYRGDL